MTDSNENMFIMNTRKRKLLSFVVTDNSIHLTENVRPSIRYFTIITQEIIQSNSNIIHQNFIVLSMVYKPFDSFLLITNFFY